MRHQDIPVPQAIHAFAFVSFDDPALDSANEVEPHKAWLDLNDERVKIRNITNTAWIYLGAEGDL